MFLVAGIFEDCVQGRMRLMTVLTPAYAHAFHSICVGRRAESILVHNFRLLAPKASVRQLPGSDNDASLRSRLSRGIFTNGGTHTQLPARSPSAAHSRGAT